MGRNPKYVIPFFLKKTTYYLNSLWLYRKKEFSNIIKYYSDTLTLKEEIRSCIIIGSRHTLLMHTVGLENFLEI